MVIGPELREADPRRERLISVEGLFYFRRTTSQVCKLVISSAASRHGEHVSGASLTPSSTGGDGCLRGPGRDHESETDLNPSASRRSSQFFCRSKRSSRLQSDPRQVCSEWARWRQPSAAGQTGNRRDRRSVDPLHRGAGTDARAGSRHDFRRTGARGQWVAGAEIRILGTWGSRLT